MTTWADLTNQITLLTDDTGDAPAYSEELRIVAWNRACEYFAATHTGALKFATLSVSASGDGVIVGLPSDFLQVGGVSEDGAWLEPNLMIPGADSSVTGYLLLENGLYMPDSTIATIVLWYYAFYIPVVGINSIIFVPRWAEWALLNLTLAYLLTPSAIGVADLRRFQSKREAGTPEDNPSRIQAKFFLQQYLDIASKVRPQDREMLFKPGR